MQMVIYGRRLKLRTLPKLTYKYIVFILKDFTSSLIRFEKARSLNKTKYQTQIQRNTEHNLLCSIRKVIN